MKQRRHRKAVQQRMGEAPTQYDRDCGFYGNVAWTKRERKAIATGKPVPLMFLSRIHMIALDTLTHRTIGPSDMPGHVTVTDHHAIRPYQQAIIDALDTGMGWVQVDGAGEARAVSRGEAMKP